MKCLKSCVLAAVIALAPASVIQAEPQRYQLDPSHTTVAFLIDHVGYAKTLGQFTEVSGNFFYDEATETLRDVQIVVQTSSVSTHLEARDKHVRSKDFLHVDAHPQMSFTMIGETPVVDGKATLEGMLSLLGKSRPLVLEATLNKSARYPFGHKLYTLGASATGQVMRSEHGMDYGVANALVGDTIDLIIEIEANQK